MTSDLLKGIASGSSSRRRERSAKVDMMVGHIAQWRPSACQPSGCCHSIYDQLGIAYSNQIRVRIQLCLHIQLYTANSRPRTYTHHHSYTSTDHDHSGQAHSISIAQASSHPALIAILSQLIIPLPLCHPCSSLLLLDDAALFSLLLPATPSFSCSTPTGASVPFVRLLLVLVVRVARVQLHLAHPRTPRPARPCCPCRARACAAHRAAWR